MTWYDVMRPNSHKSIRVTQRNAFSKLPTLRATKTPGGGGTWPMFGYRGVAEGWKSWPCLGQEYAKNPTPCRTAASISRPCLGQVAKCTLAGFTWICSISQPVYSVDIMQIRKRNASLVRRSIASSLNFLQAPGRRQRKERDCSQSGSKSLGL